MTRATPTRDGRPAVFLQQLHRAAAQRGRLDPVYQDLSDHWTLVLQRLYPVWALIGPGLSDPGHIEIHSRTVYLDSETLLGSRESIAAGTLEQRAILRCFGVALHETLHAKHTKRWAIEHDVELSESYDPAERQLAVDRRLLEEPRMEAHGVREFPPDTLRGRFVRCALQTAVIDVILPAFAEQLMSAAVAGLPLTRDLAARASVYLQARTHYGTVEPATLDPLRVVWRAVLGGDDLRALDDLYAKVIWIPDGELDRLDEAAREYRRIVGKPDGLIDPTDAQLRALTQIVCRLLVRQYRELIAYGAGWTDPERQQPVGDTGRHEPRQLDAIVQAELEHALADPDPLRGIAQLTARWAAAFVLDPAGVTRTKALGSESIARKLRDALPGGEGTLRAAVWEFIRPMLSPALVSLNRDAFVVDQGVETTVDLHGHRAPSGLDDLVLGEEPDADAA